ncbi:MULTISPECIES: putative quinol monooxygenase [Nocardia]|uniref:putative quinol monooxygenase n=1 Tax=Nocardia TaxID=1817 RepID=UPI00082A963B|nr:putative quinol monooxygenase [Nocardia xishanensis]
MAEPCVVVATMFAKPGQEELVEKTLRAAAPAVHAEPGCLLYALHRRIGEPGRFVMIEKWASKEALRTHGQSAALREVGAALGDALTGPAEVLVFDALPAGDPELGAL